MWTRCDFCAGRVAYIAQLTEMLQMLLLLAAERGAGVLPAEKRYNNG